MASRSEPAPELAVVVTSSGFELLTIVIVPLDTVKLLLPWVNIVLAGLLSVPLTEFAEESERLPVLVKFAERVIFPVVLLPIVRFPAVMLLSSVWVSPRFEVLSAPPRSTPAPSDWMTTWPAVVALTLPNRRIVLVFSVISLAAERMPPELRSIPTPDEVLPGVVPDKLSVARVPVVLKLDEFSRVIPLELVPVPKLMPLTSSVPLTVLSVDESA